MKRTLFTLALLVVGCGRKAEPVSEGAPDAEGASVQPNAVSAAAEPAPAPVGKFKDYKRDPSLTLDPHMKKLHDERMKAQREQR